MKRAVSGEVLSRVAKVALMIIEGKSKDDIVRISAENWDVKLRQIENYIQKAKEAIEKEVQKEINYDYSKAIIRFEQLYKACIDRKDYKTALSANKELASLQGLYKSQIEHTGQVQFICSIPD
jgi:hypothetical protein